MAAIRDGEDRRKRKLSQENIVTTNALQSSIIVEDDRTGLEPETLKRAILDNLFYIAGRFAASATPLDYYTALSYTVRDRLLARWLTTSESNLSRRCPGCSLSFRRVPGGAPSCKQHTQSRD